MNKLTYYTMQIHDGLIEFGVLANQDDEGATCICVNDTQENEHTAQNEADDIVHRVGDRLFENCAHDIEASDIEAMKTCTLADLMALDAAKTEYLVSAMVMHASYLG